jgi:hypothetical protein
MCATISANQRIPERIDINIVPTTKALIRGDSSNER